MAVAPSRLTTSDVLAQVFGHEGSTGYAARREQIRAHVISQSGEPRWIIIGAPSSGMPVLRSWAPWKRTSRMQWRMVRLAARSNALPLLPGISNIAAEVDTSYWRRKLPSFPARWSAVVHVGSPSHTRKAILFLVDNGARVTAAAKIPLAPDAPTAILNEAEMLDRLSRFEYLPRVLFRDRVRGIAAQSWLEGKPVGRGFGEPHLNLLNSLARESGNQRVCDERPSLERALQQSDHPFDRSVLARGLDLLDSSIQLPAFVEHRDFAPWNLKWIGAGALGLLDWEWAEPEGLPWQDACRHFYLDDVHFHGSGHVWESLTTNEVLLRYRQRFDIPDQTLPALTMRYLLRELIMEWDGGNQHLADYAYQQICALLAAIRPIRS